MGDQRGLEFALLKEVERRIRGRQCRPEQARKAELATLAQTDISEVADMSRAKVLVRLGDRGRCEGFSCRIRKNDEEGPWIRGLCRRYGMKVFHFIPYEDTRKLDRVQAEVEKECGAPEFSPLFEEALEKRIGQVLAIDDWEIVNDFEWALHKADAQVQRAEQQLGRLRSDMHKLGNAYRRLLNSRGGKRDANRTHPAQRMNEEKKDAGQNGPER